MNKSLRCVIFLHGLPGTEGVPCSVRCACKNYLYHTPSPFCLCIQRPTRWWTQALEWQWFVCLIITEYDFRERREVFLNHETDIWYSISVFTVFKEQVALLPFSLLGKNLKLTLPLDYTDCCLGYETPCYHKRVLIFVLRQYRVDYRCNYLSSNLWHFMANRNDVMKLCPFSTPCMIYCDECFCYISFTMIQCAAGSWKSIYK